MQVDLLNVDLLKKEIQFFIDGSAHKRLVDSWIRKNPINGTMKTHTKEPDSGECIKNYEAEI